MNPEGETPPQTGDEMVRYDRFVTLARLRVKSGTVSRYIVFPSDMGVRIGDEVSLKVRKHGTERWYSTSTRTSKFGSASAGVYIYKTLWECMEADVDDLLDIDVEVWYADTPGKQTEEGDQTVPQE